MTEEKSGFFKRFHAKIEEALDEVTRNNFTNLETNASRVSYVCSLKAFKDYDLTKDLEQCKDAIVFPVAKDFDKAKEFKNEGNEAVRKGDWAKALQLYSQSLVYMPKKESKY